jgi:hypothetical protein
MATAYVAKSTSLQKWGLEVGLTKHLYKVGIGDSAEDAVEALNRDRYGGRTDWKLLKKQEAGGLAEADALARLAAKEKAVEPRYYPQLKGGQGIFKVKLTNVENHMLLTRALAGIHEPVTKVTPADIAHYLLICAAG